MKRFAGVLLALAAIVFLVVRFWPEAAGPEDAQVLSARTEAAAQEVPESEVLEGQGRQALEVLETAHLDADPLPTLSAVVETEDGAPAGGATVSARWEGGSGVWTADKSGRVSTIESAAFPSTWTATLGSQVARLELEEAPASGEVAFRLRESRTLRGRVFREDGEHHDFSLAAVAVTLWRGEDREAPVAVAWADADGHFAFPGIDPTEHLVLHVGGGAFVDQGPRELALADWLGAELDVPLNYLIGYRLEDYPSHPDWSRCAKSQQGRWRVSPRDDFGQPEQDDSGEARDPWTPPWHFCPLEPG